MRFANAEEQLRLEGFQQITRLEIGLRRLLERELEKELGARWWKTLPQDVKVKVVEGSLDHVDFPDLKKCINSKWRELRCFHDSVRREHVVLHLEELEPIRNDLAHSRNITSREIALINAAYRFFEPLLRPILPQKRSGSEHPAVTLIRIRRAIERDAPVARSDVRAIATLAVENLDRSGLVESLEAYNRVRRQARHTRPERVRSRSQALETLDPFLGAVSLSD
jgi:Swt1-like HEPN